MSLDFLFAPAEHLDQVLVRLLDGASPVLALGVALLLGVRHASDPDHLVAVTSLVSARDGDVRSGVALGMWWGLGHAATLVAVGTPLILLKSGMPGWLAAVAEKVIGAIIVLLALRILWRWLCGEYLAGPAEPPTLRTRLGSFSIGVVHGLGGTAAVVLLFIAAAPDPSWAIAMLAIFAPMSIMSMAACTGFYAWALTRPTMAPVYRSALIPALGCFGVVFGGWYAGLAT